MTEHPTDAKLLPCPFPHEVKRGVFVEIDNEDFFLIRVSCSDCGCDGPYVTIDGDQPSKSEWRKAVEQWNTRMEAAKPSTPPSCDDWRCINCKLVISARMEPDRCSKCKGSSFAHIVPSTPIDDEGLDTLVEKLSYSVANAILGEGPSVRCEGPTAYEIALAGEWVRRVLTALKSPLPTTVIDDEGLRLREALKKVSNWRKDCHAYDDDMGHELRDFIDEEDWDMVESFARKSVNVS